MPNDENTMVPRDVRSEQLDLQSFEERLLEHLATLGLPVDQVLAPIGQRTNVLSGIDMALEPLDYSRRGESLYLSKFYAAVAAGLFDAALNYLWDETVSELRRHVAGYDLAYFFDLAVGTTSERRKKLSSADDLPRVEDQELIRAANSMGLLSDTGLQQLDLVRYMRNHASAAHPNQVQLRALQLLGYLEACIAEVMTIKPNDLVIEIKRLLANIKNSKLDVTDVQVIASTLDGMPGEQADNLGNGLFGIYTRVGADSQTRSNIRLLLPELWPHLSEDTKFQFGIKAARYRINHQQDEAQAARELLDTVDASSYLPDELRTPEIDAALDALLHAHEGWNNFSNEGAPARLLQELVGSPAQVPGDIRAKYVRTLIYVFLTNGYGESWSANSTYVELISQFTTTEARIALGLFSDRGIINRLHQEISDKKFRELFDLIDSKIVSLPRRALFEALKEIEPGRMYAAHHDRSIMRLRSEAMRATRAASS